MKYRFLLSVMCIFSVLSSKSQQNPYNDVSIASPNAASLGKYADVPVNAHTGIPQVSIPIYTVKEGPLSIPISLSYYAGGMKVWETSSWVGMGWSLNAGGVITRSVQGAPDEKGTSNVDANTHGYLSDSGFYKYLWTDNIPTNTGLPSPDNVFSEMQFWSKFAEGKRDGEPDIFFFNFLNYSGRFYIRDDGKPVIQPEQDLRIQYQYSQTSAQSIQSFTITTPDGTKYEFGRTTQGSDVDPIEITNTVTTEGGLSQGKVISSWYLNRIVSADGVFAINIRYKAENYSYYTLSTFPIKYYEASTGGYRIIKNVVSGVRLDSIITSSGYILFAANTVRQDLGGVSSVFDDLANTESRRLDAIEVKDNLGERCKRFDFQYDYTYDSVGLMPGSLYNFMNLNRDRYRLRLLSVQEKTCNGTVVLPPHSFSYFSGFIPRRLSFSVDHWGFFNGATNSVIIPTYYENDTTIYEGANREPAWPAMRNGSLSRITYPTGGYTDFDFESHSTWVSYIRKLWEYKFGLSAGYDGSSNWNTSTQSLNGGVYRIDFSNPTSIGSQAFLEIYRVSDNVQMGAWVLEPLQSLRTYIQYASGNYLFKLKKLTQGYTGNGAVISVNYLKDSLIQKNEIVGGLRLKSLTHNDGVSSSTSQVTNYSYLANDKSTGFLYSRPAYAFKITNDIIGKIGFGDGIAPCPITGEVGGCISCGGGFYMKSGSSIRPMSVSQGNHIGYNEVRIEQPGNGYEIKRFFGSDSWDTDVSDVALRSIYTTPGCPSSNNNYPFAPLPYEYQRGELKYNGFFNNGGQLMKESWYTYEWRQDSVATPGFIASVYPNYEPPPPGSGGSGGPGYLGTFYNLVHMRKYSVQNTESEYSQASGMVQTVNTTYFESPYHSQPTRTTSASSKGEILETKMKYALDFRISSCDQISSGLGIYRQDTLNAFVKYQNYRACGNDICRWWAWQVYMRELGKARSKYVTTRYQNYSSASSGFASCVSSTKNTADDWLRAVLDLQQKNIHTPIETSVWRGGKLASASFNKHEVTSANPVGAVYPAKMYAVNLTSPSATFTQSAVSGSTITRDSRYELEATVQFSNGNPVEVLPKAGVRTSFAWGHNNTVLIAKAVGADVGTLNTALSGVSGNVSQLWSVASLAGKMTSSYTYSPFWGVTNEYNSNGRKTVYEYDALGRLAYVKDHDNFILKRFCYSYSGQPSECNLYYSGQKQGTFTKNDCPSGQTGSQVLYVVPQGKHVSTISPQDADNKAQADVNNNGQAYANTNGACQAGNVNVEGYNGTSYPFKVKFSRVSDGAVYEFNLPTGTFTFSDLGNVPAGVYNVQFLKTGGVQTYATFFLNSLTQNGMSATFNNVSIISTVSAYME